MSNPTARHVPVLLAEVLGALAIKPGARLLDGTFGAGGYTRAMLQAADGVQVLALDRDPNAVAAGFDLVNEADGRLTLVETEFSELDEIATQFKFAPLDGVALDIGVSSMQLDEAERGFSFRMDGPLDMRMASGGASAADLVNEADEAHLADIIFHYGEERRARQVARAIASARADEPIRTTKRLADIVTSVVRAEPGGIHPATRSFQGLRIAVNDELGELNRALHAAERALKPGGRLAVVTFHSLEDRIVKLFLTRRSATSAGGSRFAPAAALEPPTFTLVGRGHVSPSAAELTSNPRARSAKLRAAERTAHPARPMDVETGRLAGLPEAKPGAARSARPKPATSRKRRKA
jgi:16S rRNA (cytosine1402-N4)-methyltransferase